MDHAIAATGVTKLYRRAAPGAHLRTLKSALLRGDLTSGLAASETITALDDVSFTVEKGQAFGVIGGNGSGKSTLLKMVAGILKPSRGTIAVDGRVAALIELGAGFHPEISGRENIFINGAVLGLPRREVERRYDSIVAFSGLGDFIEEPVKNYSSGMYVRLGFAVAIHTDPEVLLVDEVLAVGDEAFAHRCLAKVAELVASGRTLLLVSHSLSLVEEHCDRVLWLDHGKARRAGEPRRVIDAYREAVAEAEGEAHRAAKQQGGEAAADGNRRWGSGEVRILQARMHVDGREHYHLASGATVAFEIEVEAAAPVEDFVFGVAISTPRGVDCWGTNTDLAGFEPGRLAGRARVRLECPALRLGPGEYVVDVAAHARDGKAYDYWKGAFRFAVTAADRGTGIYFPEHRWSADGGLRWQPREP